MFSAERITSSWTDVTNALRFKLDHNQLKPPSKNTQYVSQGC